MWLEPDSLSGGRTKLNLFSCHLKHKRVVIAPLDPLQPLPRCDRLAIEKFQ
jgi:hypothetical protein